MAKEGGIEMLVHLLQSTNELTQRQASKALANLGVNAENKRQIAVLGGIPGLVQLSGSPNLAVRIEAVAALANLAVNDANEVDIVQAGGLEHIVSGMALVADAFTGSGARGSQGDSKRERELANLEELGAQCARALRNLSINRTSAFSYAHPLRLLRHLFHIFGVSVAHNKALILRLDTIRYLEAFLTIPNERITQQVG